VISFGVPPLLHLSRRSFGWPGTTPTALPPAVSEIAGPSGFADPAGLHARVAAVIRSEAVWPASPDVLVIRARDLLEMSGQSAAMQALEAHASDARATMNIERYASWLEGAVTARIVPEGTHAWRVQDRGGLNTLRVDLAEGWAIDMTRSRGVLGISRFGTALFAALDPASEAPFVALISMTSADTSDPTLVEVVEAGPALSHIRRKGCETTFITNGGGRITVRASAKPVVTLGDLPLDVTSAQGGVWQLRLPAGMASQTLSISVGCPS
jgi:hypothetical protein